MKKEQNGSALNSLKRKNQREVLALVRHFSPISIAEIAEKTALSKVTITKIMTHYRKTGLVITTSKVTPNEERGKPPNMFALNPDYKFIFSVKIDSYNMLATLTDLRGRIFASHTALYDHGIDLHQLFECIGDAFHMLVQRENRKAADCLAVAAGLHGIIDPDTGVCYMTSQFPHWGNDIPMRDMLGRHLPPGIPIHLDNWTHYFGRGEVAAMAEPVDRFVLLTSEIEGLNGAVMADGKVFRGHDCLSGEIGHMIVDSGPEAEVCKCGGTGCFEATVSPLRLVARMRAAVSAHPESALYAKEKQGGLIFRDILHAANAGDAWAREEMRRIARFFAIGVRNIMQIVDPELVIIQGEYAEAGEFFLNELRERIPRVSLPGLNRTVRVEYSRLGQYGAIIGAANYAADVFFADM